MMHSIATVSLSGTLDAKLRAIAAAGFGGVEIFENDLLTHTGSARETGELMRALNLKCTVFQPFRDFEGMPPELRQRTFDRAERKFDIMQELGTDLLLVCSNVSPMSLSDRHRIIDDFRELGERAAARGLRVGFEALAWGRHISDHRDSWAVVKAVNHPAIGLVLDTFHSLARAVPMDSLLWIDMDKVFLLQIADAPLMSMDPLSWSRHFRCMPGQGDLPLIEYVGTLADSGYAGPWSLEIFNDRFRSASVSATAVDGRRSLLLLQDQIGRQRSVPARDLLAPPVQCSGVEFIELCASEDEAPQLAAMLGSLGFVVAGHHRSKAVTRWVQNEINLVINCETEGFAHNYDVVHGASVCAIGLRVEDVDAAMRRAQQLQMESFSQPVGPGELRIPSIRGLGGSLIYFVDAARADQVWDAEFIATGVNVTANAAGLLRVDHIAQAMPYEEMLSWLLYYVALFDVSKRPPVEIADPAGLVVSQAVQSADGRFRITLNGSAAAQTLAARFLTHFMGAGVQYISVDTADIFATAALLQERGMDVLTVPPNYYDDLAARFGLSDERLKQLEKFNILYDRDGDGEYFQLYSRAFVKRFFFEVVQRRNYDAYGVANAAIRIAAQSRFKSPE